MGLYIDSQLTWEAHVDYVAGKLKSAYFAIVNLKNILSIKQLISVYYALVYSHLKYMLLCWGQATELERILLLQKRIIRKIFSLNPVETCKPIFKTKKILTVTSILIMEAAIYVKKHSTEFPTVNAFHNYPTRHSDDLHITNFRLATFKKSPHCFCSYIFNKLPNQIKTQISFRSFKNHLRNFLLEKSFYSVNEYFAS